MDTSYLLRLLTGQPNDLAEKALARFQAAVEQGDSFSVSDTVVTEAYYALQHHYGKSKKEAIEALKGISEDEAIAFSPAFESVIALPDLSRASPGFLDRVLSADYRQRGQITISCEKSFRRLPDVEVVAHSSPRIEARNQPRSRH